MIQRLELSYKSRYLKIGLDPIDVELEFKTPRAGRRAISGVPTLVNDILTIPSSKKLRSFINSNEGIFELLINDNDKFYILTPVLFKIIKIIKIRNTTIECTIQKLDKRDYKIDILLN